MLLIYKQIILLVKNKIEILLFNFNQIDNITNGDSRKF